VNIKTIINPVCSLAARACERSPVAASTLRALRFRGKGLIVEQLRSEAMQREVLAKCNGINYRLDLSDDVQRELYFGIYEQKDRAEVLSLIPSGGTCIDAGANNGAWAMEFARKVGPTGMVHAFEPDPGVFSRLLANRHLNAFENVVCHQRAVSNINGRMPLFRSDPAHSGWGSLVEFHDIAVETRQVEVITLDSFVHKERISRVNLLKVDVEAHEPELLEGSAECLRKQIFEFVLIEFNGTRLAQRGKSLDDLLTPFLEAGYVPVRLRLDVLQKLRDKTLSSEGIVTNLLFAPLH
jgi:FkbM family methyltransferase